MVTRRTVLKGAAAASIGAIAAAHGAAPAEAAVSCGFGQLTGGAVAEFQKFRDAFQVAMKFDKWAADIFIKEVDAGGVGVFVKIFEKFQKWTEAEPIQLSSESFKSLKTSDLYFSKVDSSSAEFFLKDKVNNTSLQGTVEGNSDGVFFKYDLQINRDEIS